MGTKIVVSLSEETLSEACLGTVLTHPFVSVREETNQPSPHHIQVDGALKIMRIDPLGEVAGVRLDKLRCLNSQQFQALRCINSQPRHWKTRQTKGKRYKWYIYIYKSESPNSVTD